MIPPGLRHCPETNLVFRLKLSMVNIGIAGCAETETCRAARAMFSGLPIETTPGKRQARRFDA
jgi:hypothetical protein